MQRGVAKAIAEHHREGHPVPIGRDGQILLLYPDGTERPLDEVKASEAAKATQES